jgi:hypothetical protein
VCGYVLDCGGETAHPLTCSFTTFSELESPSLVAWAFSFSRTVDETAVSSSFTFAFFYEKSSVTKRAPKAHNNQPRKLIEWSRSSGDNRPKKADPKARQNKLTLLFQFRNIIYMRLTKPLLFLFYFAKIVLIYILCEVLLDITT